MMKNNNNNPVGKKWRPGKKPGEWFWHIPSLGPCVSRVQDQTLELHFLKLRGQVVKVENTGGWICKAVAQLPGKVYKNTSSMANVCATVRIPDGWDFEGAAILHDERNSGGFGSSLSGWVLTQEEPTHFLFGCSSSAYDCKVWYLKRIA